MLALATVSAVADAEIELRRREARVRRILRRDQLRLRKNRADGLYCVVDGNSFLVWGSPEPMAGLTLEEIENDFPPVVIREELGLDELVRS